MDRTTTTLHKTNLQHRYKTGLIRGKIPTSNESTTKEPEIRQDFIWGAGPLAIETITKREFNTDPDTINTEKLNYSKTITFQNEKPTTAGKISSGQNKKRTKHRKNTGES